MSFCLSTPNHDTHRSLSSLLLSFSLRGFPLYTSTIDWEDHEEITRGKERITKKSQGMQYLPLSNSSDSHQPQL
jgi:hypothetical protein